VGPTDGKNLSVVVRVRIDGTLTDGEEATDGPSRSQILEYSAVATSTSRRRSTTWPVRCWN